jgi:hypothetical protein
MSRGQGTQRRMQKRVFSDFIFTPVQIILLKERFPPACVGRIIGTLVEQKTYEYNLYRGVRKTSSTPGDTASMACTSFLEKQPSSDSQTASHTKNTCTKVAWRCSRIISAHAHKNGAQICAQISMRNFSRGNIIAHVLQTTLALHHRAGGLHCIIARVAFIASSRGWPSTSTLSASTTLPGPQAWIPTPAKSGNS